MQLDDEQDKAAYAHLGRFLCVAPPGSGKTLVATERIRRLVERGIPASTIVAVTFTNRAASEMRRRVVALCGKDVGFAGTIHGLARYVLELLGPKSGLAEGFTIWDEDDRASILAELCMDHRIPEPTAARVEEIIATSGEARDWAERCLLKLYVARKTHCNAEDLDGLISRAARRLVATPTVLSQLRRRWLHYTIDEVQDTDGKQDALLYVLRPDVETTSAFGSSVFRIGDPAQAIYSWRGAKPELIEEHRRHANGVFTLRTNYRAGAALALLVSGIAEKAGGVPGEPARPGGACTLRAYDDLHAEIDGVAASIAEIPVREPSEWRKVAVLARTNAIVAAVAARLRDRKIPVVVAGERRTMLGSRPARAMLNTMRAAMNPGDDHAVERAFRGLYPLPSETWKRFKSGATGDPLLGQLAVPGMDVECEQFRSLVRMLREGRDDFGSWDAPFALLVGVAGRGPYGNHDVALGMGAAALTFARRDEPDKSLGSFVRWLVFQSGADELEEAEDGVVLSTVHLAKGLEWPIVYLPALVEGHFPCYPALRSEERMAEELRTFYVAVSRAADVLHASWHKGMEGPPDLRVRPSRFIDLLLPPVQ